MALFAKWDPQHPFTRNSTHRQASKGKRGRTLQVSSLNRELQVLRRMFHLAQEWGKVEKALPAVKVLPGERHRERVLTPAEERLYFMGASTEAMAQYANSALLRDGATLLYQGTGHPGGGEKLPHGTSREGSFPVL